MHLRPSVRLCNHSAPSLHIRSRHADAEEIPVHTFDIARGLGLAYRPPDGLSRRIGARLFPWAPTAGDPWDAPRWAAGRIALPDRPHLGPDWYWHPAPLAAWDGTIKRRTSPPPWR